MIRRKISIHAPCTGSDGTRRACGCSCSFQFTLPARGATTSPTSSGKLTTYFNPRSLHGERLSGRLTSRRAAPISIHAPCTGSDGDPSADYSCSEAFQSTLPALGATTYNELEDTDIKISIHAPCTGSDPKTIGVPRIGLPFQSTLPARGATKGTSLP